MRLVVNSGVFSAAALAAAATHIDATLVTANGIFMGRPPGLRLA